MPPKRQGNANTESVDNYLKAIFALSGPEERRVSSSSLADRLGVAPASVTNMLQKLATAPPPLWNTKDTAAFSCRRRVNDGHLRWCAIIA